ncbi:MAG TPA: T9SS type A sorting domain-containing protein [Bacteroidales bacterium]|nr:T9SS type A sorting domain-containing protein [Bacteroidales bacterium]
MKKKHSICLAGFLAFQLLFTLPFTVNAQSYLVGPVDPSVGSSANYTSHNHFDLFSVLNPTGIYIDSVTIYPSTASAAYTIIVQNSSQVQIASYSGVSTVGSNLPERIKVNLFVPMGTGYRLGLTTSSVGMLRNSTGIVFPYTVPNLISITGTTFQTTYWYFFYNMRVSLPATQTDAGISAIAAPGDSVCAGSQPVEVTLKNYGPNSLTGTTIHWSVNNVAQTPFTWTGSVPVNGTSNVTVGNYTFTTGTPYDIKAYTHQPNSMNDTVNGNDTLTKTGVFVKTAPTATFNVSAANLCAGDTLTLSGTLTGTPPWTLVVSVGTIQQTFANITSTSYAVPLVPTTTATYTLVSVSDATGCITLPGTTQTVTVNPAPPAMITPVGSSSACFGDSVSLMASVGLNFGYLWYKDGVQISGNTSYALHTKESGNYTVQVTSPIGCKNTSAPVTVTIHPLPMVNLGNDTVLLLNKNLPLNAGAGFTGYLWSTGATGQFVTIDTANTGAGVQTIWVMVTDNNGCVGSDTLKINFTNNPGMEDEIPRSSVGISPNPSKGTISLTLRSYGEVVTVELYSTDGKKSWSEEILNTGDSEPVTLNLGHLPDGMYLLKVTDGLNRGQNLLIIQK